MADHTTLHINCQSEQKHRWMLTARIAGMSFEDWVKHTLDTAVIEASPGWLDGLSERARVCLLGAGLHSREALLEAIDDGLEISTLPNAGSRVQDEVLKWLK